MSAIEKTPLAEVLAIRYGKALKESERVGGGSRPVFGSNGIVGRHDRSLVDEATIVIGRKGSVGAITYAPEGGWPIDTTFYVEVLDKRRLDLRYLFWALREAKLDRHTITTSIPGLNRDRILGTKIPLPPLAEQRRIAAILDRADAIRRKRQESLRLTDTLAQAAFLNFVGPASPAYAAWPVCRVADLAADGPGSMRTGPFGSALRHSEFADEGLAVLGIDNAVSNRFEWAERRFITEEKYRRLARYRVYPGDVIITLMGTTGRSAVVPDDIPLAISTKHLAVITVRRGTVHPEFLSGAIHRSPDVLRQVRARDRGSIMKGLNLGLIKELQIPLPPLEAQKLFATALRQIRSLQDRLEDSEAVAQLMTSAFQHSALAPGSGEKSGTGGTT